MKCVECEAEVRTRLSELCLDCYRARKPDDPWLGVAEALERTAERASPQSGEDT